MQHLRLLRLLPFVAGLLFVLLGYALYFRDAHLGVHLAVPWFRPSELAPPRIAIPNDDPHPIVSLIARANADFEDLQQKETFDLPSAAHRYREKRGRHPPPGFGKWWKYASDNGAVMIEELWDQIYDDLNPLWGLDPKEMLRDIRAQDQLVMVRKGKATYIGDHFWIPIWQKLVNAVAKDLPDMDLAMNPMDEPRLLVPWENIKKNVEKEQEERQINPVGEVIQHFSALPDEPTQGYYWERAGPIWARIATACPEDSLARLAPIQTDFRNPPDLSTQNMMPHTEEGYVANYTLSTSLCHQPDLQGLHGFLIEAISMSTGEKLFPMFGSSKLTVNSEILIPPAMYYKGDKRFNTAARIPWEEKKDSMVWRGLASGGRNKEDNWRGFHRHRLVSMLNGSQAIAMGNDSTFIDIQNLPLELWQLQGWNSTLISGTRNIAMGKWLQSWTDVAFNDLNCFPKVDQNAKGCYYTDYLFKTVQSLTLAQQHQHKYLVDVDGNSFSGRYRDFVSSGSLPIKATIFREWHDSRLVAWKHFVPMDNRFLDIYGIMEFFLGESVPGDSPDRNRTIAGRDLMGKKIALDGRDWAKRVLRVKDMEIYMYRLLLEYARVMDEKRERLGWIEDIQNQQT